MNIIYQGRTKQIEKGLTVREALAEEIKNSEYEVIGCLYNNDYREFRNTSRRRSKHRINRHFIKRRNENLCKNNCVHNGESI